MSDGQIHSKIGASSYYRWKPCPGSVRLSEGIKSVSSVYADEGTKAHEVAATILLTHRIDPMWDSEIIDNVQVYIDAVKSIWRKPNKALIEHKFHLSQIHPGLYGTADAVVYDPKTKVLYVFDLKYGQGILVEVENNTQLMYYALGALLSTGHPCKEVEMVIAQPRATHPDGPIRRWRIPAIELVDFAAQLEEDAKRTEDPNAPLNPGDWCRFCPAAGICPELRKNALAVAQTEFKQTLSYDPKVLSETLKKVDLLEDYAKAVRAFAYQEAEHGRCPPGWKLVQKRATRKWKNDEQATAISLEALLGDDKGLWDRSLKSPAQIEKLFAKGGKKELEELTVMVSSGLTLVPEHDKRPAALTGPVTEFAKIENQETIFD